MRCVRKALYAAVLRKNSLSHMKLCSFLQRIAPWSSKIVVGQESAIAAGFQPLIQVNLTEKRCH
jgi:hypothetical protein